MFFALCLDLDSILFGFGLGLDLNLIELSLDLDSVLSGLGLGLDSTSLSLGSDKGALDYSSSVDHMCKDAEASICTRQDPSESLNADLFISKMCGTTN